jgi:phthiocerol/phenolphthiocerol synthesis type-I polyketide synthase E
MEDNNTLYDIAIIGMACRFPGAENVEEFWQNLKNGVESIHTLSDEELSAAGVSTDQFSQTNYVKACSPLKNIADFDATFFGYSPAEAEIIDPQQRLFLEIAWQSLESSGYSASNYNGRIGIYGGTAINTYLLNYFKPLTENNDPFNVLIANDKDYLTTRTAYKLGLTGPTVTVQSACSTSLVAVHMACQCLLNGESDMVLAGGVTVRIPQHAGYLHQTGMIHSADGHCRSFDAKGSGTLFGSGCGVVVLKRLADAIKDGDNIQAVVKGSAVNNDGSLKVGYTAPSVQGQTEVIKDAMATADISPENISYIEAHGTATPLGDPIEIKALNQAFSVDTEKQGSDTHIPQQVRGPKQFCALGSVKTNVGHLECAAGIAGLIKTVLSLKHQLIPPSLHFDQANPNIDFADTPFYVVTKLQQWPAGDIPRTAGVSSFGIGGTNAHVILQQAPEIIQTPVRQTLPSCLASNNTNSWHLLPLSAKTGSALNKMTANLLNYIHSHQVIDLADIASTLQSGRQAFSHRQFIICQNREDSLSALKTSFDEKACVVNEKTDRPIIFMFPGQSGQRINMAKELYDSEPLFSNEVNLCSQLLQPILGFDICQLLYPTEDGKEDANQKLQQTAMAQPALFIIEYSLAKFWLAVGIKPVAMIGHSLGEYVAASLSGVLSLKQALQLVVARGKLMESSVGSMLAVSLSENDIQQKLLLYPQLTLSLAATNAPLISVVSGKESAIKHLENELITAKIPCQMVNEHYAFHSDITTKLTQPLIENFAHIELSPPQIPYISNLTGSWITEQQATDSQYWANHMCQTVRFSQGISCILEQYKNPILLDIGPSDTLSSLVKSQAPLTTILTSMQRKKSVNRSMAHCLGQLWLAGQDVNWGKYAQFKHCRKVSLPTYPFERQHYFVKSSTVKSSNIAAVRQPTTSDVQKLIIEKNIDTDILIAEDNVGQTTYSRPAILSEYIEPRNQLEQTLAGFWREILGVTNIGVRDNFFELGGHSLLATQVISRLTESFPVTVALQQFFEMPTVEAQATYLENELLLALETMSEQDAMQLL